MINGRKIKEIIHDKLKLQATLLLHMFYHAGGQGSVDDSTHGTLDMHDFFCRRTIRWNTHVDDKMEEAFTLRYISRLFHAYGILMTRVGNGNGTPT